MSSFLIYTSKRARATHVSTIIVFVLLYSGDMGKPYLHRKTTPCSLASPPSEGTPTKPTCAPRKVKAGHPFPQAVILAQVSGDRWSVAVRWCVARAAHREASLSATVPPLDNDGWRWWLHGSMWEGRGSTYVVCGGAVPGRFSPSGARQDAHWRLSASSRAGWIRVWWVRPHWCVWK